jgi:hypothetical protein
MRAYILKINNHYYHNRVVQAQMVVVMITLEVAVAATMLRPTTHTMVAWAVAAVEETWELKAMVWRTMAAEVAMDMVEAAAVKGEAPGAATLISIKTFLTEAESKSADMANPRSMVLDQEAMAPVTSRVLAIKDLRQTQRDSMVGDTVQLVDQAPSKPWTSDTINRIRWEEVTAIRI